MASAINKLQFKTSFCYSVVFSGKKLAALITIIGTAIKLLYIYNYMYIQTKKLNKNFNKRAILEFFIVGLGNSLMVG